MRSLSSWRVSISQRFVAELNQPHVHSRCTTSRDAAFSEHRRHDVDLRPEYAGLIIVGENVDVDWRTTGLMMVTQLFEEPPAFLVPVSLTVLPVTRFQPQRTLPLALSGR